MNYIRAGAACQDYAGTPGLVRLLFPRMDDTPTSASAPAGWLEALAESEAQLAAGQVVDGDEVMREPDEYIAQLEARPGGKPDRGIAT